MIRNTISAILEEIEHTLASVDEHQVQLLIEEIRSAHTIVTMGAGRVGIACKGFAMRMGHLGLRAYNLGDATVPHIGVGDLLLVASGSGETQTIFDMVQIAKNNGCTVALITGNAHSRMGRLADHIVEIQPIFEVKLQSVSAHNGTHRTMRAVKETISKQPMSTLNEQSLTIFFDALVLQMMNQMGETPESLKARHSNLE